MNPPSTTQHTLLDVLRQIEARPGMFVDGTDSDRTVQLDSLDILIRGYLIASSHHQLSDPGVALYDRFPSYLERKFGWGMNQGPLRAIRAESESDTEAWDTFWRLLWEFEEHERAAG
jgi:hypothetical protein